MGLRSGMHRCKQGEGQQSRCTYAALLQAWVPENHYSSEPAIASKLKKYVGSLTICTKQKQHCWETFGFMEPDVISKTESRRRICHLMSYHIATSMWHDRLTRLQANTLHISFGTPHNMKCKWKTRNGSWCTELLCSSVGGSSTMFPVHYWSVGFLAVLMRIQKMQAPVLTNCFFCRGNMHCHLP